MECVQKCNQCNVEKTLSDFTGKKNRVLKTCQRCRERGSRSRMKNKEYYVAYNKKWKEENKGRVKEYNKNLWKGDDWEKVKLQKGIVDKKSISKRKEHVFVDGIECKPCSKCKKQKDLKEYTKYSKSWDGLRTTCNECLHEYRMNNKERMTEYNKKYWKETKDIQTKTHKEWKGKNKEHVREYMREYKRTWEKEQRETNPVFKITKNLRSRLYSALRTQGTHKDVKTFELIGCTPDFLKGYLEAKFLSGMTWDNYGTHGWHIDHIRPCVSFDLTDTDQQNECFHYSNLQPLWAADNISKGGKIIGEKIVYELNFIPWSEKHMWMFGEPNKSKD